MTATPIDALVLDARLRQSLATIRSLGRRGMSIAALDTMAEVPAFCSRWCRQRFVCPAEDASDAYVAYVEQLLEHVGARVLIPSHDGTIAVLRRHRARLERRVRLALAAEPSISLAVDKAQTLAIAERLGIRVPSTLAISGAADLAPALKQIGLPAVVKPTESWLGA